MKVSDRLGWTVAGSMAALALLLIGLAVVNVARADGGWYTMDELHAMPEAHEYCHAEGGCKIITRKDVEELQQAFNEQMQLAYQAGLEAGRAEAKTK